MSSLSAQIIGSVNKGPDEKEREDRARKELDRYSEHEAPPAGDITTSANKPDKGTLPDDKIHKIVFGEKKGKKSKEEESDSEDEDDIKGETKGGTVVSTYDYPYKQNSLCPSNPIPMKLDDLTQEDLLEMLMEIESPTIGAYGARGTGKSWIIRNCLHLMKEKYPFGIVFCSTAFNGFWQKHLPSYAVIPEYRPEVLERLFKQQSLLVSLMKKYPALEDHINPHVFVLFDDVIHDPRLRNDENIKLLYTAGRHFKITVMTNSQYAKGINPTIRSNTDVVFIMRQFQIPQIESLWEEYGSLVPKTDFIKMLDIATKDRHSLVVWNKEQDGIVKDRYKRFKAVDPGPFLLGSLEFWCPDGEPSDPTIVMESVAGRDYHA